MRAFAKAFYESPAWRKTRAYILKRDAGLCVRCGAPGVIVHHKRELTPQNIDDPMISLNADNLSLIHISIEWIRTTAGRSMPIDPEPVFIVEEDGGRERFITDEGEVVAGRRALPEEEGPACAVGFVPHWKTCPAADRFRRR